MKDDRDIGRLYPSYATTFYVDNDGLPFMPDLYKAVLDRVGVCSLHSFRFGYSAGLNARLSWFMFRDDFGGSWFGRVVGKCCTMVHST